MGDRATVTRARRLPVPGVSGADIEIQAPPPLPEPTPVPLVTRLLPLVMVVSVGGMAAVMLSSGAGMNPMTLMFPVMMLVSTLGMVAGNRGGGTGGAELDGARRRYLRHLREVREEAWESAAEQRTSALWTHPDPADLWSLAGTAREGERSPGDDDHLTVRVGVGRQRLARRLVLPDAGPPEDLDPASVAALRRLVRSHSLVAELPVALALRGFPVVAVAGEPGAAGSDGAGSDGAGSDGAAAGAARALVRAMIAGLATFHTREDLAIALVDPSGDDGAWEWLKWLPHHRDPAREDAAAGLRLRAPDGEGCAALLGELWEGRGAFGASASVSQGSGSPASPHLVVVLDETAGPVDPGPLTRFRDGVTLVAVSGGRTGAGWAAAASAAGAGASGGTAPEGLRLRVGDGRLTAVTDAGDEVFARPDAMTVGDAEVLARRLSRSADAARRRAPRDSPAGDAPPRDPAGLPDLLGWGPVASWGPDTLWRARTPEDRLRVAIGRTPEGRPLVLDLKQAAEGGMGPHGLCVGATGSGNPEPE